MSDATDRARALVKKARRQEAGFDLKDSTIRDALLVGLDTLAYIDALEGPHWVCDKCDFSTNSSDRSFQHCFETGHSIGNNAHDQAKRKFEEAIK